MVQPGCVMGIRLMVEVLDNYHGPDALKLWLLAFAEKANDQTRQGWPGREILAHRTGRSASRVSHIAAELVSSGTIKRVAGGGRHRGETRYELLPLTAAGSSQGAAAPHSENRSQSAPQNSQGAESGSQGAAISSLPAETPHNPQNPQEPSSAHARADGPAHIIRTAYPDATDDEIEAITKERISSGARSAEAVLAYEIRHGTLRLPCNRDGPGRHSNAGRVGDPGGCTVLWCNCRCHTEPAGKEIENR
jgi:hypothetical protein